MKWSTDHALTLGERTWRGENARETKMGWMMHCNPVGRQVGPKTHKKCILTLIIGLIFAKFWSHDVADKDTWYIIRLFDLTPFWRSQRSKFNFPVLTHVTLKSRSNSDAYHVWCNFTKYSYSQHLVILAIMVTSEMAAILDVQSSQNFVIRKGSPRVHLCRVWWC